MEEIGMSNQLIQWGMKENPTKTQNLKIILSRTVIPPFPKNIVSGIAIRESTYLNMHLKQIFK